MNNRCKATMGDHRCELPSEHNGAHQCIGEMWIDPPADFGEDELSRYLQKISNFDMELRAIAIEIALHCPCGARPESPQTHPHVPGCSVYKLLKLVGLPAWSIGDAYSKAVAPKPRQHKIKQPDNWTYWMKPPKNNPPQCESMHGIQQCQKFSGHDGPHQECNEVWTHA